MPLSKAQLAQLVREMPDASDEEILAEAKKRGGDDPQSLIGKVWDKANAPLTDIGSRAGKAVGDAVDQRTLDESPTMAKLKGFTAGAAEAAGGVLDSFSSPLNLALSLTGLGGAAAARRGLTGAAKAAGAVEAALNAPLAAEGAKGVFEGVRDRDAGKAGAGALEAAIGLSGVRGGLRPHPSAGSLKPALEPAADVAAARVLPSAADRQPAASVSTKPNTARELAAIESESGSPSGKVYSPDEAASIVAQLHSQNQGSTFNLHKGDLGGTDHYAVSVHKGREVPVAGKDLDPAVVKDFIDKNHDLLQDPANSMGTWFNPEDGKSYLDVSQTVPDLDQATKLGLDNDQLGIFDLKKFETLNLKRPMPEGAMPEAPLVREMPGNPGPEFQQVVDGAVAPAKTGLKPPVVEGEQPLAFPRKNAVAEQKAKLDAFRADAQEKRMAGGSTALALAGPAAAVAIPDDPDSNLDDYGRIGLMMASTAALAAGVRTSPLSGQKAIAMKAAGRMLAGMPRKAVLESLVNEGVPKGDIPKIHTAAKALLEKDAVKAGQKLAPAKKLAHYFQTGQGEMKWYDDTYKAFQDVVGKDAEKLAGFFTATSINATVKSNATLAMKAYAQWKSGEPFKGYLPAVIAELNRVAADKPLAGRKLDNFRKAIIGDPDAVVVDRWMLRAFGMDGEKGATPHSYDLVEHAVKQMAQQHGVTPRQMQAAIWFGVKNAAEAGKNRPASPPFEQILREKVAQTKLPFAK
jgi:hypothetical protein